MQEREDLAEIRRAVRALCDEFPGEYWREKDRDRAYPSEFVDALTKAGFLAALIPEEYGGSGLKLDSAAVIMEEIQASGSNGGAAHAQMYVMNTLLRYGSEEQKAHYLPKIADGTLRLQAFGVSEPTSGTDTLSLRTFAKPDGDQYVINGQKIWTSRAEHSDLMMLLARTTPKGREREEDRGAVAVSRRHAGSAEIGRDDDQADPHDDEPFLVRGVLRRSANPEIRADRRGREGLSLHPLGHECGTGADRGGMYRRCEVVHRDTPAITRRSGRFLGGPSARTRASSSRLPDATPRCVPPS